MRILLGCEKSGNVREAMAARGYDAWSCDLEPSEKGGQHIMGDVRRVLSWGWDAAIFFPPCQYIAVSGLHWNKRVPGRSIKTDRAIEFVRDLLDADIPCIALENPIGCISSRIRKPDQVIQPYQFGEDASKATCLWLKGLPKLRHTGFVPGRITADGKTRWANQTDSGQNKLAPSPDRAEIRAITYPGIAAAMAEQWGDHVAAMASQRTIARAA